MGIEEFKLNYPFCHKVITLGNSLMGIEFVGDFRIRITAWENVNDYGTFNELLDATYLLARDLKLKEMYYAGPLTDQELNWFLESNFKEHPVINDSNHYLYMKTINWNWLEC